MVNLTYPQIFLLALEAQHTPFLRLSSSVPKVLEAPAVIGDVVGISAAGSIGRRAHCLLETSLAQTRCIACLLCAHWCPVDCLFVGAFRTSGRSWLRGWVIDRKRCVFCGNCSASCPVVAITQTSFPGPLPHRVLVEVLRLPLKTLSPGPPFVCFGPSVPGLDRHGGP